MKAALAMVRRRPTLRPRVLGILNVTPDSFSDGGSFEDREDAVRRAWEIAESGADALDVGGESTRPGAVEVSVEDECRRVLPVLDRLAAGGDYPIPVSIDTRRRVVAIAAHERGATIVNDTSALRDDPELAAAVAELKMTVVLMHRKGVPRTMQQSPSYEDVVGEVRGFLEERVAVARQAGIDSSCLIVDPGIGFGKRVRDNLTLLAHLPHVRVAGVSLMVGASRKSFLGRFDDRRPADRLPGSLATAAVAAAAGVEWIRVHDVRATVTFLDTLAAIRLDRGGDRPTDGPAGPLPNGAMEMLA